MAALSVACRRLFDTLPPFYASHVPLAVLVPVLRAGTLVLRGHPVAL